MLKSVTTLMAATLLTGCAALSQLTSDVSTYGQWPEQRKPGTYAFERLPSQQSRPEAQQLIEDAARHAIEGAGFTPASDATGSEFIVQLGARVNANDRSLYDDPFWWRGSLYYSRRGYWGPGFGFGFTTPTYEREVALLIRDRKSGQPLFEARATNEGSSSSIQSLLPAMFDAAMKDFPHGGVNPRRVTTEITRP